MRVRYWRTASHRESGTRDRSSCANCAARAGGGGAGGTCLVRGTRSRTTSVPAKTSPRRRPSAETSDAIMATEPAVNRISTKPIAPRTSACRNRIGPPSLRTTRSPNASFPSERPRLSVSTATGPPTRTSRSIATCTACAVAEPSGSTALSSTTDSSRYTPTTTARSSATAIARVGSRAGWSPRTTASPVTSRLIRPPLLLPPPGNPLPGIPLPSPSLSPASDKL